MNTRIITDMEGFQSIQEDWERLERQDPDATYYSTFQFNYFWWNSYREDKRKQLFIICCYQDERIVGIAPLMMRQGDKKILSLNTLCFLGKGDYFTFLLERQGHQELAILNEIFDVIHDHADRWDKLDLTHLAQDSQLLYYLLSHDQYNEYVHYLTSCPIIDMKQYGNFEQFSQTREFPKLRKTTAKFRKTVPYQFKVITGDQDPHIYERVSHVHRTLKAYLQSEKGRQERRSLFEDKYNEHFLKRLFRDNDQVVFFLLEDEDGEIIIYSISYLHRGVLYDWNTGYSPKYSYFHGLSNVLLMETVQYLFERQVGDRIDCGAGSYAWKFKWTDQFKVNYSLKMWNILKIKGKLYRFLNGLKSVLQAAVIMGGACELLSLDFCLDGIISA